MKQIICEKTVAESLKIILLKKGFNYTSLAHKLGKQPQTVSAKFKNGNFKESDLKEICDALNVTYSVSFTIDGE